MTCVNTISSWSFRSNTSPIVNNIQSGNLKSFFKEGGFKLNGAKIRLSRGDSLWEIADTINTKKHITGVKAKVVRADGGYKLELQSGNKVIDIVDYDGVLSNLHEQGLLGNSRNCLVQAIRIVGGIRSSDIIINYIKNNLRYYNSSHPICGFSKLCLAEISWRNKNYDNIDKIYYPWVAQIDDYAVKQQHILALEHLVDDEGNVVEAEPWDEYLGKELEDKRFDFSLATFLERLKYVIENPRSERAIKFIEESMKDGIDHSNGLRPIAKKANQDFNFETATFIERLQYVMENPRIERARRFIEESMNSLEKSDVLSEGLRQQDDKYRSQKFDFNTAIFIERLQYVIDNPRNKRFAEFIKLSMEEESVGSKVLMPIPKGVNQDFDFGSATFLERLRHARAYPRSEMIASRSIGKSIESF